MGNKEFGQLVRTLRKHRVSRNGSGQQQWTQEKLSSETQRISTSKAAGLTIKQIGDIEQGKVANLKPNIHLEPLARAFKLSEAEKVEFYAVAGLIYPVPQIKLQDEQLISHLLQMLSFPATARTALWDLIAMNSYNYVLWEYNEKRFEKLLSGIIEPNLLRILFDPYFGLKSFARSPEEWDEERVRDLRAFRVTSFRHVGSPKYQQLIDNMMSYPDFERLWPLSENRTMSTGPYIAPTFTINHPKFGLMGFMSLRIPHEYHGLDASISAYVPLALSEENYQKLHKSIKVNSIYFLPQRT